MFSADGELVEIVGTHVDLTERKRAQEEHQRLRQLEADLAHMNRLRMMGELAASLILEITQPIASARNNARAALNFLDRSPPDLCEVREALGVGDADRAGDIVDRIRDHIKKAPPRRWSLDLNEAINEVIVLAQDVITKNGVLVRTRLMDKLFPVQGDRVQLQQVVLNLVLNAVEAVSSVEAGARELLISTEQSEKNGVLVAVRDSGPGIDPEHLERVFKSFYTTKSSGTGMGLSICRSIIDAHGAGCGRRRMSPGAPYFRSPCPAPKESSRILFRRVTGRESRAKTPYQMLFIHWLTKVTDHPVIQGAGPVNIIGVGSYEDCRNRVARLDEVSVECDPGHRRHVNVGDQAGRFGETRGSEEIGRRCKSLGGIAQRSHEPSHGLAKEPIIFNDRNQ